MVLVSIGSSVMSMISWDLSRAGDDTPAREVSGSCNLELDVLSRICAELGVGRGSSRFWDLGSVLPVRLAAWGKCLGGRVGVR